MSDIALTSTFQERIYERIRDSIGELMSDEDLKKLVAASLEKAFFERRVTKDSYGREMANRNPWIVELVGELLDKRVIEAVNIWINEHSEEVKQVLDSVLRDGVPSLVIQMLERRLAQPLTEFGYKVEQILAVRK